MTDSADYDERTRCKSFDVWMAFIVAAAAFAVLLVL